MRKIIIPVAIIATIVIFFVVIDRKDFILHYDNVQTGQSNANLHTQEFSSVSKSETKNVFDSHSIEVKSVKHVESMHAETKLTYDTKPMAIPVLSQEDAFQANKDALRSYNNKRMIKAFLRAIKKVALIVTPLILLVVLFPRHPVASIKHICLIHILDCIGWTAISFVVMYCVVLIFQINSPGISFLTALQPILSSSSATVHLSFLCLILLVFVYIKRIFPLLLTCRLSKFLIFQLFLSGVIGTLVIYHFSIEPISDNLSQLIVINRWQKLPNDEVKQYIVTHPDEIYRAFLNRCYYSYYFLYKVCGCKYVVIEISQLVMHLLLGINVYFLAKQCVFSEKIARLSMILYCFMPAQYLYLTIPSHDLWGGMLLCFNANLIIYLFKKSQIIQFYKKDISVDFTHDSKDKSKTICTIRKVLCSSLALFRHFPWMLPFLVSILFGITLFWMELVRNIQIVFCVPMFLFLSAVLIRKILTRKMKLISLPMLFICIFCLIIPFFSNITTQKLCNASAYGAESIPYATVAFNSPEEVREVVRFGDFRLILPEHRKDLFLDVATSYWNFYPGDYSKYLGNKMGALFRLFHPQYVATPQSLKDYPMEFSVYDFLTWLAKVIFVPLILTGILCVLFFKRWNSLAFVPIVLFFFFFIVMPTVGEVQARYTSIYYAPMCICAACTLLFRTKKFSPFRKKQQLTRFVNSILCGTSCIIILLFMVTSLFSNDSFSKKHYLISFHENLRQISSGDSPVAYKEYMDKNYLFSSVFHPTVANTIPEKTCVEWTIPEYTQEGLDYVLYGYLIVPPENNADFIVKINGNEVWNNSMALNNVKVYNNDAINIQNELIIYLDNLRFTAKPQNILSVEIAPKDSKSVDFALSAWGMVSCK